MEKLRIDANDFIVNQIDQFEKLLEVEVTTISLWGMFADIEREAKSLITGFIDYRSGSLLRRFKPIDQMCNAANALLSEIGKTAGDDWQGSCIVANNVGVHRIPNLVRISLPSEGIWSFPLLGYQYASTLNLPDQLKMGFCLFASPTYTRIRFGVEQNHTYTSF